MLKRQEKSWNDVRLLHFERIYVSQFLTFSRSVYRDKHAWKLKFCIIFAHIYVTCLLCSISVCRVSLLA